MASEHPTRQELCHPHITYAETEVWTVTCSGSCPHRGRVGPSLISVHPTCHPAKNRVGMLNTHGPAPALDRSCPVCLGALTRPACPSGARGSRVPPAPVLWSEAWSKATCDPPPFEGTGLPSWAHPLEVLGRTHLRREHLGLPSCTAAPTPPGQLRGRKGPQQAPHPPQPPLSLLIWSSKVRGRVSSGPRPGEPEKWS